MSIQKGNGSNGVQERVQGAANGILASVHGYASETASRGQVLLDRNFPPEQRNDVSEKLQAFILANPKLSTFLGMNILLTGLPLLFFLLFTITVTLSSLVIGLLLGLLGAVFFILLAVGTALCVFLPTALFTTTCACFLFLWTLGGYYILNWANGGKGAQGAADKLNELAGGRLSGFTAQTKSNNSINGYKGTAAGPKLDSASYGGLSDITDDAAQKQIANTSKTTNQATRIDGVNTTGLGVTSTV